jgi:hypothetical protein
MKKIVILLAFMLLLLSLAGCYSYSSSYRAVGFIHSNEAESAFMNFYSFEGRMVFKMKSSGEGDINFTAKLESGSASVYYDHNHNGAKQELFSVSGGEEIDSHGGYIEAGTVYIIVETDGECKNGEFRFSLGK